MKTTNNIKRTMTIAIAAAMITATAMLSGCGCDDSNAINKTATTVQTTSVEETTVSETAPTLSETDKAITDAGLKVGADGKITDKNGKEVKVDKDVKTLTIIDQGIGRLPVMEDGHLQGMITAKDIALAMMSFRKVVPDKYKPARIRNLLVEDVMVQNVKTLTEETPVSQAAQMMLDANFSGMPVVEEEQMTGILTKTDFLELIVELEGF